MAGCASQMTRFLKKAQSQVEANIQSYTKQQQAALQALTFRARQDRQTVMRLISNMQVRSSPPLICKHHWSVGLLSVCFVRTMFEVVRQWREENERLRRTEY